MIKINLNKTSKFIIYPILLAVINLLLVIFVIKYYMSNFNININSILSNQAPNFETQITSIFKESSNIENGTINKSEIEFPQINSEYGQFEVESINMTSSLIFGDGTQALKSGVGQYSGSYIPGYGGTILVTGHNYMFPQIENVKTGDIIKITTSYGIYKYKVSNIKILNKEQYSSLSIRNDKEQLIYYTCYPFSSLGSISSRYFVYADYILGPKIIK